MPDMIAARQELELRPALERLDRIIAASEGIDPGALTFAFRPLWQLDAATAATIALQKAQATQVYAGLNLWPAAVTARLVQAQLAEDGTYPNAKAVFGEGAIASAAPTLDYDPDQPRDPDGRWTTGEASGGSTPITMSIPAASPPTSGPSADPLASIDPDAILSSAAEADLNATADPPIELASAEQDARALAKLLGAAFGAGRLLRRLLPEEPDDSPTILPRIDPTPSSPVAGTQTEKNELAQSRDPRLRSDLADAWINDDGTLNWPPNGGSDGPETPLTPQPGQIVDKYGDVSGDYLSPQGMPFPARSLPYDPLLTPARTFRVLKPVTVRSGCTAAWFDEPGGGTQFRTDAEIRILLRDKYLEEQD